ncbi:hypothetical protein C8J57DRAFT_1728313 [Mycena rebaudengoi]|nr:hypothetical protein C8J57DRAFT_1728313 [Mycena rebaudengoi]
MSVCKNCGIQALEPPSSTLHAGHLSTQERRTALAKVRAQILLHKKYLDELEEEEAELEAGLSLVIYPVLTLPVEITSRIFIHCLPSHGCVLPSPSTAPLVLAQICHHWREVALSTRELWSSLYPDISFRAMPWELGAPRDHALRALIQTWFSRAKGSPLSLGLNCQITKVSTALWAIVCSFAGEIQRLDLHLWPDQFHQLRPFQIQFPLLQHLATSHSSEAEIGDFLKNTPSLRELRLVGTKGTSVNFPLPLLNRLEISAEISITTFLDVLNNFPVLSHFKYSLREPDTDGVDRSMAPVFPRLSSLAGEAAALCFVTLPSLRELELSSFSEPDHVQQFLARSSCTVDRLTLFLGSFGVDEEKDEQREEFLIWLKTFPSLSVLHIRECIDVDVLIECLDSKSLAPRLSEITINSMIRPSNMDNNYDNTLVALLRRRTNPRRSFKLRKFHMRFSLIHGGDADYESRVWTPGDLAESALSDIIADGLDFLLQIESSHAGTLTWPSTYIDPTDPLPFFP